MSRPAIMQQFLRAFRQRLPRLSKATYSTVVVEMGVSGSFSLVASWAATRGGAAGSYRSDYDMNRVATGSLHPRLTKSMCAFHDEFICAVLQERGL